MTDDKHIPAYVLMGQGLALANAPSYPLRSLEGVPIRMPPDVCALGASNDAVNDGDAQA